jgi:hypothetical protein
MQEMRRGNGQHQHIIYTALALLVSVLIAATF